MHINIKTIAKVQKLIPPQPSLTCPDRSGSDDKGGSKLLKYNV